MSGVSEYLEDLRNKRGLFIGEFCVLDKMVEYFIAAHFMIKHENSTEFMELIFGTGQIAFERKRQIFKIIVETHYEQSEINVPGIFSELKKWGDMRNQLAHFVTTSLPEHLKDYQKSKTFTLVEYSKSTKFEKITLQKFVDYLKGMVSYSTIITSFLTKHKMTDPSP